MQPCTVTPGLIRGFDHWEAIANGKYVEYCHSYDEQVIVVNMTSAMRAPTTVNVANALTADELSTYQKVGRDAQARYDDTKRELLAGLGNADPVEVLSRLGLLHIAGISGTAGSLNSKTIETYHLELLQAYALTIPPSASASAHPSEIVAQLSERIVEHALSFREKSLQNLTENVELNSQQAVIGQIQTTTQTVRGARHPFQNRRTVQELAALIDADWRRVKGTSATTFSESLQFAYEVVSDRLEDSRRKYRIWFKEKSVTKRLAAFRRLYPEIEITDSEASKLSEVDETSAHNFLWNKSEQSLAAVFSFSKSADLGHFDVLHCGCGKKRVFRLENYKLLI